jgi:nucleoside-diphosphate kinase
MIMSNIEQTLSIIKPDAVERNLDNEIKEMFKNKGFSIVKEKKIQIEKSEAEKFYKVHETKPFYNDLCAYLSSGPIVVMVLEKENAVLGNRELMGATNPNDAEEGTIRKKYGISIDKNSVHGSDSVENAKIEIDFFLKTKNFYYSSWI